MIETEDLWRSPQEAIDHLAAHGIDGENLMPWGGEFHWPRDPETYPWSVQSAAEFLMGPDHWRMRRRIGPFTEVRARASFPWWLSAALKKIEDTIEDLNRG